MPSVEKKKTVSLLYIQKKNVSLQHEKTIPLYFGAIHHPDNSSSKYIPDPGHQGRPAQQLGDKSAGR